MSDRAMMRQAGAYPQMQQSSSNGLELTDDEKIDVAAARILERYREAFLELAK